MDIKEFAGGLAVIDGEVYEKIMVRRAGSNPYDDRSNECLIESVLNLISTDCIIDTLRKPKVNESLTMNLAGIVVK